MAAVVTAQDLDAVLAAAPFCRAFGFRVHAVGDGECTLDVPFREELERPGGIVSGQTFMAAADVAVWLAIMTKLGTADRSVTVDLKTAFLQAARREGFRCTGRILKLGRRLIYAVAECATERGTVLAHHTVTYARGEGDRLEREPADLGG